MGRPQNHSPHFIEEEKSLDPAGIQTPNCPACSLFILLITFSCLNLQICSNNKLQTAQEHNACQSRRISLCTIKSALPQCTTVRRKYLWKWEMKWRTHTGSQTACLRYKWETCHGCGDLYWLWFWWTCTKLWHQSGTASSLIPAILRHTHTHRCVCVCVHACMCGSTWKHRKPAHDSSHTIWYMGQVWQCMEMAGTLVNCNTHGEKALFCHTVRMDEIWGTLFIWSNENILCSNMLHFWN